MTHNDLEYTKNHFLLLRLFACISLRIPWEMPTKKTRGAEVTAEQQAANQALARRRVALDHGNSSIKGCRILKAVCRLLSSGARDQVMEICWALHNFRLRLDPWLPIP